MKEVTYDCIRDELDTFDIVLFSGKGFISRIIKLWTRSYFSHVGMVVKSKEYDMVLLFESTSIGNTKDIFSNKYKQGVQTVSLRDKIKKYNGKVYVSKLLYPRDVQMIEKFTEFKDEVKEIQYEKSKIQLALCALPALVKTEDLSSLFCSELVAECYQRVGLLTEQRPSNSFSPKHFDPERRLRLLKGSLGSLVRVK